MTPSELLRLLTFVPYRLPTILRRIIRGETRANSPSELFDFLHGTETAEIVKVYKLDAVSRSYIHSHGYEASNANRVADILGALPIRREQFEFVDIGCGKGRALIIANEIGFARVTGVEISPKLGEVAVKNLAICGIQSRILIQDAASYDIPKGRCVLYLYDPFDKQIVKRLKKNVERRMKGSHEDIWIVYSQPKHRTVFDSSAGLSLHCDFGDVLVYRMRPVLQEGGPAAFLAHSRQHSQT